MFKPEHEKGKKLSSNPFLFLTSSKGGKNAQWCQFHFLNELETENKLCLERYQIMGFSPTWWPEVGILPLAWPIEASGLTSVWYPETGDMPPKFQFIHRLIFSTQLDSWLLMHVGSLEGKGERKLSNVGEWNEGSSPIFYRKRDSIREGSISFFNELDTEKELCSWLPSIFNELEGEYKNARGVGFIFSQAWSWK